MNIFKSPFQHRPWVFKFSMPCPLAGRWEMCLSRAYLGSWLNSEIETAPTKPKPTAAP